jgi:hypothetical protein
MPSMVVEGPQNIEIIGAILLVYCYSFSKSTDVWKVLFVMGISGLCGNFLQALYDLLRSKGIDSPMLSILLIFNEVFWLYVTHNVDYFKNNNNRSNNCSLMEAAALYYSYLKLSVVITDKKTLKIYDSLIASLLFLFFLLRLNIGITRFEANSLLGPEITKAHSYAYYVWALCDLVILGIFLTNYNSFLKKGNKLAILVLNSSAPRMLVILINTLVIAFIQIPDHAPASDVVVPVALPWLIKRAYNVIFLIDCVITRNMVDDVLSVEYISH